MERSATMKRKPKITDVAKASGLRYDYGPGTITYSAAVLID